MGTLSHYCTDLAEIGIVRLLVEGGSQIITSFFESKEIDEMRIFLSNKLVGGELAPTLIGGIGVPYMERAIKLDEISYSKVGSDICIIGYPIWD